MTKTHSKKKKRILYIETGMGFGGAAVSLHELVSSLKEAEPVLLFYSGEQKEFVDLFKNFNTYFLNAQFTYKHKADFHKTLDSKFKNKFIKLILRKFYTLASVIYDIILARKITSVVKSENISLIHINNCIYPLLIKVAKKCNIPAVVHLRGHVDCTGPNREANNMIARLIAPTKKICNFAADNLSVDRKLINVIYNSINLESYNVAEEGIRIRNQYQVKPDAIVIGMFARIIYMKGQMELTKAVLQLLDSREDLICMFVGNESDGDLEYLSQVKGLIADNGCSDKFIFTGYQKNIQAYYNATDIVVHPSIEDEAFGRVIIESWAARKPIIATDIAASVELIDDDKTGIIVPVNDISKLSEAILRLSNNKDLRMFLANNGHEKANKFFNNNIIAKKVELLYSDVLTK